MVRFEGRPALGAGAPARRFPEALGDAGYALRREAAKLKGAAIAAGWEAQEGLWLLAAVWADSQSNCRKITGNRIL